MLIRKPADLRYSDITPKQVYVNRRRFLAGSLAFGALAGAAQAGMKLTDARKTSYNVGNEKITPLETITHYNNFYEFGTDKSDPAENAKNFRTSPWTLKVEGEVAKPKTFDLAAPLQDRAARRAHLPAPLRGSVVHCGPLDRLPLECASEGSGADLEGEIRGL